MSSQDIPLFPVYVRKIEEFLSSNDLLQIVKLWRSKLCKEDNVRKPDWGVNGDVTTTYPAHNTKRYTYIKSSLHDIDKLLPDLKLLERLQLEIDSYTDVLGYQKTKIANSWINVQYKGSELLRHIHPLSVVSGALYIQVDQFSSEICFYHPNQIHTWHSAEANGMSAFSKTTFSVQPKNGMLILFPSWLEHGGSVNQGNERMMCSFDTSPLTYKQ